MSKSKTLGAFLERDPYLESRNRTAQFRGNASERFFTWISQSLPGRPTKPTVGLRTLGTVQSLMMVDLNRWRPDVNVEMLADLGIKLFGLRVMGPTRWVYGSEDLAIDQTFVPYYERIRKHAPDAWILGYGVHNYWSNEEGNYLGLDPQVRFLKEATRNHICDLYCWDDEVRTIWKNGKETNITATNAIKSISNCMAQTYSEFETWPNGYPKIPVHYSANWFMKTVNASGYQTWLDQQAADPYNRPFLTWRAWLPFVYSQTFQTPRELFDLAATPTGTQENAYLRMGSEPAADLWQLTFTLKGPWCGPLSASGIDASISYGMSSTVADFARNANIPIGSGPGPEPEPEPEPEPNPEIEVRIKSLETWRESMRLANQ